MVERILVVDDEISLQETLVYNLERQGYQVEAVGDGREAVEAARRFRPDLILLDIMLPGMNGLEVCKTLRHEMTMPILFLTARDEEIDRILGFEIGGDDYIAKPFSMRELLARVKAHLRMTRMIRSQVGAEFELSPGVSSKKTFGNLTFTGKRGEILLNNQPLSLKPKEYELMLFFANHLGVVISREYILKNVWAAPAPVDHRTVDVHVHWLREKIEADPANPTRIVTVWGSGYRFDG